MRRISQTATEYLIILAVVIIIALIVIGTLGGIPGIGTASMDGTLLATWRANPNIAINSWAVTKYGTTIEIQNTANSLIQLTSLNISGYSYTINKNLNIGQKTTLFFFYPYKSSPVNYDMTMKIIYTDPKTNAQYTINKPELTLKGTSGRINTNDISVLKDIAYYWRANNTVDTVSDLTLTYVGSVTGGGSVRRDGTHRLTGYSTSIYYDIGSYLAPQNTPMTVSIWVNTSVCAGGSAYILGNGWGVGNRGYDIALGANFSLRVGDASMTVPCDVATWTNLVFTYDGTTATFYKNGALGSSAAPSSVSTSGNGAGTFRIGMESWGSDTATVPIEYSDVAIYNRAFTATEVASLYAEYATIN